MESKKPSVSSVASCSNRVIQRSNNELAAGTRHHAIVNAVCAVGRAEPGIPTQVVGRALDGDCLWDLRLTRSRNDNMERA